MSTKLLWSGLILMLAVAKIWAGFPWEQIGAIVMILGGILLWLDK